MGEAGWDSAVRRDEVGPGVAVVRTVDLPAGVEAVWQALTAVELVRDWFGAEVEWDVRPGGAVRVGPGDDGAAPRRGQVDEVEDGRRLRFRWWPEAGPDPDGATVVTYELMPSPQGTRLVVTEQPVPHASSSGRASAGAASVGSPWDLRLVGLWLACHTGLLVGV